MIFLINQLTYSILLSNMNPPNTAGEMSLLNGSIHVFCLIGENPGAL